jgi:dethiobiotin synthetase
MFEPQIRSVFVTGTDTGVGKTLVSTALLHAWARHYTRVVGMKPVAAGTEEANGVQANDDVLALRAASSCSVPHALDNPVLLTDAVSPHIAAARVGVRIDIAHIMSCHRQLLQLADAVVVEGAGGFMVPLSKHETGADLAQALGLPVVLVVGLRLGCLNHTLLTVEAIRSRGLTLAGWVANHIDPNMQAQADNLDFLQHQLSAPLLAQIAWQSDPDPKKLKMKLPATWLPASV